MTRIWSMLALAGSLALATTAGAQERERDRDKEKDKDIPVAHRPPPGMCRIWLEDVPPQQQPAPTDCKTALKNRPEKARVIFGDDYVDKKDKDKKDSPSLKGFNRGDKDDPKVNAKRPPWRKP